MNGGVGGSQSAGGAAGTNSTGGNSPGAGIALVGGVFSANTYGANAGGGGYYGGGCGAADYGTSGNNGGGGGGSGYYNPTYVSSQTLTTGSYEVPANSGDSDRGGLGDGGTTSGSNGDGGIVRLT